MESFEVFDISIIKFGFNQNTDVMFLNDITKDVPDATMILEVNLDVTVNGMRKFIMMNTKGSKVASYVRTVFFFCKK